MKKIFLIDASALFFRAYYAVRPLTNPQGTPVNALYGYLSMVAKLLKEEKPEHMVFCYDRKEPSFRKDLYTEYKANRTEMPEDLVVQIPLIKKLAELLGIPAMDQLGFEADDLIGTMANYAQKHSMQAVIVSGDKDFAQLVNQNVILYDTMKDIRYDRQAVFEKWGIWPEQFIDYLAIVGDASDNVPGVKGVGEKGALKLLQQFGSLEKIYENIDQIEGKSIKEKLIAAKDMAFLSKKLVTIVKDAPVSIIDQESHFQTATALRPINKEELRSFLREMNFKTFEKNLLGDEHQEISSNLYSSSHIGTLKQEHSTNIFELIESKEMNDNKEDLKSHFSNQNQIQVSNSQQNKYSLNCDEEQFIFLEKNTEQLTSWLQNKKYFWLLKDERQILLAHENEIIQFSGFIEELKNTLRDVQTPMRGFDLKPLWHDLDLQNPQSNWDSMIAAYACKAGDTSDFRKNISEYLNLELPEFISPQQFYYLHLQLMDELKFQLKEKHAIQLFEKLDLPLLPILFQMEKRGIQIDIPFLKSMSVDLHKDILIHEHKVQELAGEKVNVASPKQLGVILFEKLSLPVIKKTKTGYSTDNDVLEVLDHPIAKEILLFRELSKLKSTYVDALPQLVAQDGRVHTHFNQCLTATGRLSSTNPNLQNIPIRTKRGQLVRQAFTAATGKKLLSVDYSQIELRILAHISNDPGLFHAFANDLDIHAATASQIYGVSLEQVSDDLRRTAKAVNFGIAYGQGAFGLAETLGISRKEAQQIIEKYFHQFKGVKDYIEDTIKYAHEYFYVETLFGRRRYIEELKAKNQAIKKFGERAAINAPIQGTASDLVKKAMIELDQHVKLPMLLQVHDELIFEGPEELIMSELPKIIQVMENVMTLKVPLKVNYEIGLTWNW